MTSPLLRLSVVAAAAVLLAACGSEAAPGAGDTGKEPVATDTPEATEAGSELAGPPECPAGLKDADESLGAEVTGPATAAPTIGTVHAAWTCTYVPTTGGPTDESGEGYTWVLEGERAEVSTEDVAVLNKALTGIKVPDENRACTMDLGPRTLVLMQVDGGVIGAQVDRFGCSDTRLSADPANEIAGTTSDLGTVTGVLDPGKKLVKLLERISPRI